MNNWIELRDDSNDELWAAIREETDESVLAALEGMR